MYGRLTDNKIEFFKPYKGGLLLGGNIIINATEAQYNEAGWYTVENINEVGVDHVEGNVLKHYTGVERTLEMAKQEKIAEIDAYDTSDAVNGFTYQGQTMWIDKATRVGLVNAVDSAILLDKDTITFGIDGVSVTLPCVAAKAMLAQLELYALDCYNVTLDHKTAVESMETIAEVDAFNITVGYPEKLSF